MPALTLLVPVRDPGSALDDLVRSIDAQSAPRDTFDVVLVDGGSTDGSPARLQRLAAARPNVTYLSASSDLDPAGLVREGLEQATGDLVAVVRPGDRLTTYAVDLLVSAGDDGADAVLGRASSVPAGDHLPLTDGPLDAAVRPRRDGLLAVRRSVLTSTADPAAALLDPARADAGWSVVALGSVASLGRPWPSGAAVVDGRSRWDGTELVVEAALDPADAGTAAWLVLAREDAAEEVVVPAAVVAGPEGRVVATATVDLEPAAGLGDGRWQVRVRTRAADSDRTAAVGGESPGAAVLDGRQVVPTVTVGGLTLDLGATGSSLLGRVALADASLAESARGVLLTLRCPDVQVTGSSRTPVAVLLGRFRLPAVLVADEGRAHVESWVSGLAGRSRISVQTGGDKPRRTGLDLVIAGTGEMTLAKTRKAAAPGPATPAPVQVGGLRGLRRRVPDSLEPVVKRLAGVGPLRAAYRSLVGR